MPSGSITFTMAELFSLCGFIGTMITVYFAMKKNEKMWKDEAVKQESRFTKIETELVFIKQAVGCSRRINDV